MAILKHTHTHIILLLLTTIIWGGCQEDFIPDVESKPVLCLNSLITAGSPIEVTVTHTCAYIDSDNEGSLEVEDARISIYANGEPVSADYLPQPGDKIRVEAMSPTYGSARAEVRVPPAIPVELTHREVVITDSWNESHSGRDMLYAASMDIKASLKLSDMAGEDNYFLLSYAGFGSIPDEEAGEDELREQVTFYPGTLVFEAEPLFSEHLGVLDLVSGNDASGFPFFTDRQFADREYTLRLKFKNTTYSIISPRYDETLADCGIIITLSTLSESYYNWANYKWQTDEGLIGDLADVGLADPMWGYSNVSTGAGVVAAQTVVSCTLNLQDVLLQEMSPGPRRR